MLVLYLLHQIEVQPGVVQHSVQVKTLLKQLGVAVVELVQRDGREGAKSFQLGRDLDLDIELTGIVVDQPQLVSGLYQKKLGFEDSTAQQELDVGAV